MCEAGREEPFDELSAWIFSPTLTRHSHLMGSQLGFLSDADPAHHLPGDLRTTAGLSEKCAISPVSRRSDRFFFFDERNSIVVQSDDVEVAR